MPQIAITKWTVQQLANDVATATSIFRTERIGEPKQKYDAFFDKFETIFGELIDELPKVFADPPDVKLLSRLIRDKDRKKAFRYLGAPPISQDDLKTLAEAGYGPTIFKRDAASATRVRDLIGTVLDAHRFPWIDAGRAPTNEERAGAIAASAAMAATRDVETSRRHNSKQVQEQAVKDLLKSLGMKEVAAARVGLLERGPTLSPD